MVRYICSKNYFLFCMWLGLYKNLNKMINLILIKLYILYEYVFNLVECLLYGGLFLLILKLKYIYMYKLIKKDNVFIVCFE